jgi:hypothetical protein
MMLTLTLSAAAVILVGLLAANRRAVGDYLRSTTNQSGDLATVEEFFVRRA